jgi:hypothetical protein
MDYKWVTYGLLEAPVARQQRLARIEQEATYRRP